MSACLLWFFFWLYSLYLIDLQGLALNYHPISITNHTILKIVPCPVHTCIQIHPITTVTFVHVPHFADIFITLVYQFTICNYLNLPSRRKKTNWCESI